MATGLSFVGTVVTCCLLWSPLARLDRKRVGVLTINNSMNNNNEQQHQCRSLFGCHVTLGDVAPANAPHPSHSVVMRRWSCLLW